MTEPPSAHQRLGPPGQIDEAVAAHLERLEEVRAARIDEAAVELGLVGIGDGVDEDVEPAPFRCEPLEDRVERGGVESRRPA
jgi:hypothetical protein